MDCENADVPIILLSSGGGRQFYLAPWILSLGGEVARDVAEIRQGLNSAFLHVHFCVIALL